LVEKLEGETGTFVNLEKFPADMAGHTFLVETPDHHKYEVKVLDTEGNVEYTLLHRHDEWDHFGDIC